MTKAEIVKKVAENTGMTGKEAYKVVELVLSTCKEAIVKDGILKIAGFGTFTVRSKSERMGRVVKTGEEVLIPARKVVTFKASDKFKEVVQPPRRLVMSKEFFTNESSI